MWIGECVHDMRSALDHIAYALNVAGSGQDPPPNAAYSEFPLYTSGPDYAALNKGSRTNPAKSKIGHLPHGARTVIESFQPYHRRKNYAASWLGVLHELSRIDKHRHFPITAVLPLLIAFPNEVEGHPVIDPWTPSHGPLKVGTTLMRLTVPTLPTSAKEPQVNFPYALGLNFHGKAADPAVPLILPYEPVNFVLPSILDNIRRFVLPAFAPFFEG